MLGVLCRYCDKLFSKRKDESHLLLVKFDPDWSDDFSHKGVQSSDQSEAPYHCSPLVRRRIDFSCHNSREPLRFELFVCSQISSLLRCVHAYLVKHMF